MEGINEIIWSYFFLPCVLVCGAVLTRRCAYLQFRRFGRAIGSTIGRAFRSGAKDESGVTPLQAASTALAATVGTGNIVGTAQAIAMGGRGAVFWLWVAALFGMIIKYAEVFLAVRYRKKDSSGKYIGGPMYYIELGLGSSFVPLAVAYAAFAALSVLSMGNLAQINGSVSAVMNTIREFTALSGETEFRLRLGMGFVLALTLVFVMAGDAKRVGKVTQVLVPAMSLLFVIFTVLVVVCHAQRLLPTLGAIVTEAFSPRAAFGAAGGIGLRQAIHWGIRRSAFSNEAGLGFAAIAHGSAQADCAPEHALWGIFEVFADTIVICTLTALAILCSGVSVPWGSAVGSELLQSAFATVFGGRCSSIFMAVSLFLFAFSTVLGCSIYGVRCVEYIFGERAGPIYRFAFAACVVLGSVMSGSLVWAVADTANAFMSVPNFIALFALSGKLGRETRRHFFQGERIEAI